MELKELQVTLKQSLTEINRKLKAFRKNNQSVSVIYLFNKTHNVYLTY